MRILMVANMILPPIARAIGSTSPVFGGWVGAMLRELDGRDDIELGVVSRAVVPDIVSVHSRGVTYFAVPSCGSGLLDVEAQAVQTVLSEFSPDILHVEGSESSAARRFLKGWPGRKVLSAQGILNGYAPYEMGSVPASEWFWTLNPGRWLTGSLLYANKFLRFNRRLKTERETIALVENVLGRTTWDRSHLWALNNDARYFKCSRILRDEFYSRDWQTENCRPHSIFVGSMSSPRKGGHFAIRALALLSQQYPDVTMRIAGHSPVATDWSDWKRRFGYPAYLRSLIRQLGMQDRVQFLGILDAEAMASEMERAHVAVLPSIIENSPNTLGEAMMVGVPCVAAVAGGVLDMADSEKEALVYRDDDPAMLAFQTKRIFDSRELAVQLSKNSRVRARMTHDPAANASALVRCYKEILADTIDDLRLTASGRFGE